MRIVSIGTDRGVFAEGSAVRARQRMYAESLGELDLIVFSTSAIQPIHDEPLTIYPTNSSSRWFFGRDALRVARGIQKPDVITAQDPFETGLAGCFIAKRFGVPLHVQIHTDFLSPEFAKHSLLNRVRVQIAKFVLRRASRIRVVSDRIKSSLKAKSYKLQAPITVLPIFVDLEKFRTARAPEELIQKFSAFKTKVLVVSRLEPEKNVSLAIRAFAEAAPKDSCLIIIGQGSRKTVLVHLARELGITDQVFFEGAQDPAPYYALSDLVLVPSKYEGYGLVIVEALAAGKPVLATNVGVAQEVGAIVADEKHFPEALKQWFASGSRIGELRDYPYKKFGEYVEAYCADLSAVENFMK